jgi:hypothetical protein
MKVALVGSSSLDMAKAAGPLLNEMTKLPVGTTVLLRRPASRKEPIGLFEQVAARLTVTLGYHGPTWYEPDIEQYSGRAATFERDIRMAQEGDRVIAFFPEGKLMTGGTSHVVEKFHDALKKTDCYEVDDNGGYQWVAGMEPVYSVS